MGASGAVVMSFFGALFASLTILLQSKGGRAGSCLAVRGLRLDRGHRLDGGEIAWKLHQAGWIRQGDNVEQHRRRYCPVHRQRSTYQRWSSRSHPPGNGVDRRASFRPDRLLGSVQTVIRFGSRHGSCWSNRIAAGSACRWHDCRLHSRGRFDNRVDRSRLEGMVSEVQHALFSIGNGGRDGSGVLGICRCQR